MMNRSAYKKNPVRRTRTHETEKVPLPHIRTVLKSIAITVGGGFLLLLALSLALYFSPNPSPMIRPAGLVAAALTALLGGFTISRMHGQSALLCGLINGSALMALMLLLSLFFTGHGSSYSALVSCLLHAGIILLSVVGAYLGLHRTPKKKSRKR